jgi:hypothetical protein
MLDLHVVSEMMREPNNPARYGRNPVENQQLLNEAANEGTTVTSNKPAIKATGSPAPAVANTANEGVANNSVSQKARQAQQLTINKQNSLASEAMVRSSLDASLSKNEMIIDKPRIYIDDGKNLKDYATPDFAIFNKQTEQIVRIPEAKDGGLD